MDKEKLLALIRKEPRGKKLDERLEDLIRRADKGDVESMIMVADCFNRGQYTEVNQKRAFVYYLKAANRGDRQAELMVGLSYLNGIGVEEDEVQAINYIKNSADKGNAQAQYLMGCYYDSRELDDSGNTAFRYFSKSAEQGHAGAQIELGLRILDSEYIKDNVRQGLFWVLCAYMHGENDLENSNRAKEVVNHLIQSGLPGGRDRIDAVMNEINHNCIEYTRNP